MLNKIYYLVWISHESIVLSDSFKMESQTISQNAKTAASRWGHFCPSRRENSGPTNFKLHSKHPSSGCQCCEERARPRAAAPSSVSLNLYRRGRLFAPLSSDLLLSSREECEEEDKEKDKKKEKRTSSHIPGS